MIQIKVWVKLAGFMLIGMCAIPYVSQGIDIVNPPDPAHQPGAQEDSQTDNDDIAEPCLEPLAEDASALMALPSEILRHILGYLTVWDWARLAQCCRGLAILTREPDFLGSQEHVAMTAHLRQTAPVILVHAILGGYLYWEGYALRALENTDNLRTPDGLLINPQPLRDAMRHAVMMNRPQVVDTLLQQSLYNGLLNDVYLRMAVEDGYTDIVKVFIRHRLGLYTSDVTGNTLLHIASQYGRAQITQLLLDAGLHANARNHEGQTPLCLATEHKHDEVVTVLQTHPTYQAPGVVHRPALLHNVDQPVPADLSPMLSDIDLNIHNLDDEQRSPLPPIESNDPFDVFAGLLIHRADLPPEGSNSPAALHGASSHAIPGLIAAGADVNTLNEAGQTPLWTACYQGNYAAAVALIHAGADVMLADIAGWTPLHAAAGCGHIRIIRLLLDNPNVDLYRVNVMDFTALEVARLLEQQDVINLLLEAMAIHVEGHLGKRIERQPDQDTDGPSKRRKL